MSLYLQTDFIWKDHWFVASLDGEEIVSFSRLDSPLRLQVEKQLKLPALNKG